MKYLILLIVFIFINNIKWCTCGTWSEDASHPDHPGMCIYKEDLYPTGEIQITNRCVRLTCSPNGWISGHSCPDSNPELSACFRGGPISIKLPFPTCCKRTYTCQFPDKSEYKLIDF